MKKKTKDKIAFVEQKLEELQLEYMRNFKNTIGKNSISNEEALLLDKISDLKIYLAIFEIQKKYE